MNKAILFFTAILLISLASASDFGYDNPSLPRIDPISPSITTIANISFNESYLANIFLRLDTDKGRQLVTNTINMSARSNITLNDGGDLDIHGDGGGSGGCVNFRDINGYLCQFLLSSKLEMFNSGDIEIQVEEAFIYLIAPGIILDGRVTGTSSANFTGRIDGGNITSTTDRFCNATQCNTLQDLLNNTPISVTNDRINFVEVIDDFCADTTDGETNWGHSTLGAQQSSLAVELGEFNHPCMISRNSGASAVTPTGANTFKGASDAIRPFNLTGNATFEVVIKIGNATSTNLNYSLFIGYFTQANDDDGFGFNYNNLLNGGGVGHRNLSLISGNGGVTTSINTSTAGTNQTWYRLKSYINPACTNASYYINGVFLGQTTSNIPCGKLVSPGIFANITGTPGRQQIWYLDYFRYNMTTYR